MNEINSEKEQTKIEKGLQRREIRRIKLQTALKTYDKLRAKYHKLNIDLLIGYDEGDHKRLVLLFFKSTLNIGKKISVVYIFNKNTQKWENRYSLHSHIDFYSINNDNEEKLEKKEWKLLVDENLQIIEMSSLLTSILHDNPILQKLNVQKRKKKKCVDNTGYLNKMVINKKSKESFGRIVQVYKYVFVTNTNIVLKRLTENIEWILREC